MQAPTLSKGRAGSGTGGPATSFLPLLIAIAAVGPFSLNILMPALPSLSTALQTDVATAQLTLSLYLVGMAVAQLFHGALSDRFGRRPVLIGGLLLTVAASVCAMLATSIHALIAARTLQAVGASTGIVISRAIIRDLYERDRAASMIGWVTMVIMVVPMIVPPLGGAVESALGWQAIFAVIGLFATVVLAWVALRLPETLAGAGTATGIALFARDLGALLRSPLFLGYVLCGATGSALFFAFLGGAPHIVITQMGRSSFEFGLWFATAALGYMLGNYGSARWSARLGVDRMVATGAAVGLVGAALALGLVLVTPRLGPAIVFLPQFVTAYGNGLLLPNAIAGAISVRPHAAGTASGITGSVQMAVGAAGAQLVSHLLAEATNALPMAVVLMIFAVACALAFAGLVWRRAPRA